jgi:hypothetical protein
VRLRQAADIDGMKTLSTSRLHSLPPANDMARMLQLANELHGLPPRRQVERALQGLIQLTDASIGLAWVVASDGATLANHAATPAGASRDMPAVRPHAHDAAAAAMLKLLPLRQSPAVRMRSDLVPADEWKLAGPLERLARRDPFHDAAYSLAGLPSGDYSLIALYRGAAARPFSAPDHTDLLHFLHPAVAWVFEARETI